MIMAMCRYFFFFLLILAGFFACFATSLESEPTRSGSVVSEQEEESLAAGDSGSAQRVNVYVIPIKGMIGKPNLYILRRGIKEAVHHNAEMVILDMDTPGGRGDIMLEMMKMLDRFEGTTATYVNEDAISAGSFIAAVTDEIYFVPRGKIGASAIIQGTGEDLQETALLKAESYLRANVRVVNAGKGYREQVLRAMLEKDYIFEIGDALIKPAGELLTLTAKEAVQEYGDPPQKLLGEGIYESIEDLLDSRFGEGAYSVRNFEITYSEEFAKWINAIAPALLSIGVLLLFIEFKTPSFGLIGGLGLACICIFFLSSYIAGLAGKEMIVIFALGILLILVEIIFMPGVMVLSLPGVLLVLGSLVWALADIWPEPGGGYSIDGAALVSALEVVVFALMASIVGIVLLWRYLPKRWFMDHIVSKGHIGSPDPVVAGGGSVLAGARSLPAVGSIGRVTKPLHPLGEVEIAGTALRGYA